MNTMKMKREQGYSFVFILIILAVIGIATYIGLQYAPQRLESASIDTLLSDIEQIHEKTPYKSAGDVQRKIDKYLNINQMDGMGEYFDVSASEGVIYIDVFYERELNLIYKKKTIAYERSLSL